MVLFLLVINIILIFQINYDYWSGHVSYMLNLQNNDKRRAMWY
jgi:hypothetical protein